MNDSELDKWMLQSLEEITKMNMISQMEYRAKEYELKHNNAKHIIYAAIISGGLIGIAGIIAGVLR